MDGFSSPQKKRRRHLFRLSNWRNWSGLPKHLLLDIADKLTVIDDYIIFGRVCVSWRSVFLEKMNKLGSPILLIAPPLDDTTFYKGLDLYSLSTKRVYKFCMQLPHGKSCRGSSFGWLVIVEEKGVEENDVQLQNPLLNRTINLPPLDNIARLQVDVCGGFSPYVTKAALSSDPLLSDDYIVMGIMSRYNGLAFFKRGDKYWTSIGNHWILDWDKRKWFTDVIFFNNARQFYALLVSGAVVAIEFRGDKREPKLKKVAPPTPRGTTMEMYLVEDLSSGDLLQVQPVVCPERDQDGKRHLLVQFFVFKFDSAKRDWTKLLDLGDKVLFVGDKCSILRSASDCPGCIPNHIYYTNNDWPASYAPGIYNLQDGAAQPQYLFEVSTKHMPSTIWLDPTLNCNSIATSQ